MVLEQELTEKEDLQTSPTANLLKTRLTEIGRLNAVRVDYVYLRELLEPRDNFLKIVVEEAVGQQRPSRGAAITRLEALFGNTDPIESTDGYRTFKLYWERYAAYILRWSRRVESNLETTIRLRFDPPRLRLPRAEILSGNG